MTGFGIPKYCIIICLFLFAIWNSTYLISFVENISELNYTDISMPILVTNTGNIISGPATHYTCKQDSIDSYYNAISKTSNIVPNSPSNSSATNCNCILLNEQYNKKTKKYSNKTTICLPTFFIIGVSKCGTSSLYYYLMEDERFVTALAKELWHTHIPYANHVFEKYIVQKVRDFKYGMYLNTFNIDGQFGEDKQCVDTQMNNSTQQTCLFRYNDHEKYINKVKSMQWPILQAFNRTNRTIPAFLLTSNVTDVTNYKKSIVLKDRVDDINNKVDNGVDNGIGIGIGKRMMMVTDATPDYHFYADIPKGLNQQFPTSKIVLINRHMLHRAISTYRYVIKNDKNLTKFVNVVKEHKGEFDGCVAARNKYRKGGNGNSKDNVNEFVLQETNQHWM